MNDIEQIARRFEKMPGGEPLTAPQAVYQPSFTIKTKDIEQNHLCLAFPGIAAGSPDRYRMQVLSNILGGGMSSRLFQRVREQKGLCYTIYSFSSAHRDTGCLLYTSENRRYIHSHAGVGFDLDDTVERIMSQLRAMGIEGERCGKAGVVVTLGKPGKTILLRGDIDALPIPEQTNLPFASQNGCMHACGHDFHAAMLLGAAKLLKENESALPGTVKLMFQPAEEKLAGARDMVENGVLENPHVDAALSLIHI